MNLCVCGIKICENPSQSVTVSEATLKIRVFNFLQNQIIYFPRGDSLGVPFGTPFQHFRLTPHASASLQRTGYAKSASAHGLVMGVVVDGGKCCVKNVACNYKVLYVQGQ